MHSLDNLDLAFPFPHGRAFGMGHNNDANTYRIKQDVDLLKIRRLRFVGMLW